MSGYFDDSLARLGYAAPQLLTTALAEFIPFGKGGWSSWTRARHGVVRSAAALQRAPARGRRSVRRHARQGARTQCLRRAARGRAGGIHARASRAVRPGDLGRHAGVFRCARGRSSARHRRHSGRAASSHSQWKPSRSESGEKHRLHEHGRYSHSADYVRECLEGAGFELLQLKAGVLRKEMGADVQGHVVLARRKNGV